jgi:hypothetical protein
VVELSLKKSTFSLTQPNQPSVVASLGVRSRRYHEAPESGSGQKKMTFRCTSRANVAATDSLGIGQFDISQEQGGSDRINLGRKVFRIGSRLLKILSSLRGDCHPRI